MVPPGRSLSHALALLLTCSVHRANSVDSKLTQMERMMESRAPEPSESTSKLYLAQFPGENPTELEFTTWLDGATCRPVSWRGRPMFWATKATFAVLQLACSAQPSCVRIPSAPGKILNNRQILKVVCGVVCVRYFCGYYPRRWSLVSLARSAGGAAAAAASAMEYLSNFQICPITCESGVTCRVAPPSHILSDPLCRSLEGLSSRVGCWFCLWRTPRLKTRRV